MILDTEHKAMLLLKMYQGTSSPPNAFFANIQVVGNLQYATAFKHMADAEVRQKEPYFDYYLGKPIKCRFYDDSGAYDFRLYDRDAGAGAGALAMEDMLTAPDKEYR